MTPIANVLRASGLRTMLSRLRSDRSGLAMLEFGLSLPLVIALGMYGVETANQALINLKISQIALNLADNASRVGVTSTLSTQQLRELDMNDVLQAARYQGSGIKLTTYGRVTLSSLENVKQSYDTVPVQRIHWQRCIGLKNETGYRSTYGVAATSPTATYAANATYEPLAGVDTDTSSGDNSASRPGSLAATGMGDAGAKVNAPAGSGVMFVEINYRYQPLVGDFLIAESDRNIHYVASFIVRDRREFSQIYNPVTTPATTRATCDLYAA